MTSPEENVDPFAAYVVPKIGSSRNGEDELETHRKTFV